MDLIYPVPGQIEAARTLLCVALVAVPALVAWLFWPSDETD